MRLDDVGGGINVGDAALGPHHEGARRSTRAQSPPLSAPSMRTERSFFAGRFPEATTRHAVVSSLKSLVIGSNSSPWGILAAPVIRSMASDPPSVAATRDAPRQAEEPPRGSVFANNAHAAVEATWSVYQRIITTIGTRTGASGSSS